METRRAFLKSTGTVVAGLCLTGRAESRALEPSVDLWQLAQREKGTHRFSTLFPAQHVRDLLASDAGLAAAVDWCQKTAVTKVYVEEFRDGYQADRATLLRVKARFTQEGIEASGCITPTGVGKSSTGWKNISCYTDKPTQQRLKAVFEYAAGLFDEIIVDDFWFTDCACADCDAARKTRTVTIGDRSYPVSGDSWEDYRCELMVRLSRDYVLAASKAVNPKVQVIIKYPQWYDRFHERGYEIVRESADFDRIWVGTETRDYADQRLGGTVQYEAYFIMRWLGRVGGTKCGGGWFDPYGTTEHTYVEQARQTVLGGARESMLFCYGSLLHGTGPKNVEALRQHIPELFQVARELGRRPILGIAACKPPNSHPEKEERVFDFVGMLGLPLVPCHEFPAEAPAAFFSAHLLKDPAAVAKLTAFIKSGKPVLITDGLAQALGGKVQLDAPNVQVLQVKGDPKSLLRLSAEELVKVRQPLLQPWKTTFRAPNQVALYLFADGSWVVENFNDQPAAVELNGRKLTVAARGWQYEWK